MTDNDDKTPFEIRQTEISVSIDIEAPPRDIRRLLGGERDTIKIFDSAGHFDGEYRVCRYCGDDSLIDGDYYETHLEEEHGLQP